MEVHKNIKIDNKYNLSLTDNYMDYFTKAFSFVGEYYLEDLKKIIGTNFSELTPETFFREYQWVVYTSGFNAKIVSKMFPALQEIYRPLYSTFVENNLKVNTIDIAMKALEICNNKRKVKSIIDMAFIGGEKIKDLGWAIYKERELNSPDKLQKLPFIGEITKFHLARNIGLLDFVKPDLHLKRMAEIWGFRNPVELCKNIQNQFDLPLGIIDLVLWYGASTFGTK